MFSCGSPCFFVALISERIITVADTVISWLDRPPQPRALQTSNTILPNHRRCLDPGTVCVSRDPTKTGCTFVAPERTEDQMIIACQANPNCNDMMAVCSCMEGDTFWCGRFDCVQEPVPASAGAASLVVAATGLAAALIASLA